jgi:hypothetical protein
VNRYVMSWTIGTESEIRGGHLIEPSFDQVMEKLASIATCPGTLSLDRLDGLAIGPQQLQVHSENNQYLITLGEKDADDYNVRSFTNKAAVAGQVEILGDYWDKKMICQDFQLVIKVFQEFLLTGDVSREILS